MAGQPTLWPPPPPAGPRHRPLAGQAAALTVLLAAIAVANLTVSIAARLAPTVSASVGLGELLLHLLLVPVFLVWFYRARKNADGRGQDQRLGPGWAIGAWVTPFVSLWFPYQIMSDIWRANQPAEQRTKRAWLPGFWWACFLAGNFLGVIAFEARFLTSARPASGQLSVAYIPYGLLVAAAAILLIVIVRIITRGPVGRKPVAAQAGMAPQDGVAGLGPYYPQIPVDDGGGHLAAGVGYALSALAVVVAAALTATAIYGQSIRTTPVAARTPTPAATHMPAPGVQQLTLDQLRAGDCIQRPPDINTASTWPDLVTAVPCTERHIAEVIYSGNYWPAAMTFPGNAKINRQAEEKCVKIFHAYDGISYANSEYTGYDFAPQGRSDWDQSDRLLMCVVFLRTPKWRRGEALYASIKNSHE
jgi:hypothetical protein